MEQVVYYVSMKREPKTRPIHECRCDERLKTKNEESIRLTDTGLVVELEQRKTKTRLKDEKFVSVTIATMCINRESDNYRENL